MSSNKNKIVSSNPAYGEVYSIQHYVIKSVTCDRFNQVTVNSNNFVSSNHAQVLNTTLHVCVEILWLTTGPWFSPGTPVSSTNKTDRHDITEILLKVSLNTTTLTPTGILAVNRELVRGSLNPVRGRINPI